MPACNMATATLGMSNNNFQSCFKSYGRKGDLNFFFFFIFFALPTLCFGETASSGAEMMKSSKKSRISLRVIFRDFSSNSTIHGVRYINDARLWFGERVWWTMVFSMSIITCCVFIKMIVTSELNDSPSIISFSSHQKPTSDVTHISKRNIQSISFRRNSFIPDSRSQFDDLPANEIQQKLYKCQGVHRLDA